MSRSNDDKLTSENNELINSALSSINMIAQNLINSKDQISPTRNIKNSKKVTPSNSLEMVNKNPVFLIQENHDDD